MRTWLLIAMTVSGLAVSKAARGQALETVGQDAAQKERVEQALKLSLDSATTYEMSLAGKESTPLTFRKEPVLRWSNPERGEIYGNVFIWTDRGRPEIVGSLFKWYSPFTHASHEFESFSICPMIARREGKDVWKTDKPGVELQAVPDAPAPAESATARLTQMRQFARKFAARSTDREGNKLELRLLTQPIYRYERPTANSNATTPDWLDGALFVFVQGTDPEVFLMIEARRRDGELQWQYGLTRMNSIAFQVTYDRREVWSLDVLPWADVGSHREPYTSFMIK